MGMTFETIKPFLENYKVYNDGRIWSYPKNDWKIPAEDKDGYLRVTLWFNGQGKSIHVHRLVVYLYLDNPDNKPQINHKNLDKKDNTAANLEWVTAQENIRHSVVNETRRPRAAPIILKSPHGQLFYCDNRRLFTFIHNLGKRSISNLLSGVNKTANGWSLYKRTLNEEG